MYRFAKQTLKRMAARNNCEIRVRLLRNPLRLLPRQENRFEDVSSNSKFYEIMVARGTIRNTLSFRMGRELKIVYRLHKSKGLLAPVYDNYRRHGLNSKITKEKERQRQRERLGLVWYGYVTLLSNLPKLIQPHLVVSTSTLVRRLLIIAMHPVNTIQCITLWTLYRSMPMWWFS